MGMLADTSYRDSVVSELWRHFSGACCRSMTISLYLHAHATVVAVQLICRNIQRRPQTGRLYEGKKSIGIIYQSSSSHARAQALPRVLGADLPQIFAVHYYLYYSTPRQHMST